MPARTANQQVRYPDPTDAPNGPLALQQLAEDVERLGVMRFASVADRNTRLPNPVAGMFCTLANTANSLYHYSNGAWRPYLEKPAHSRQGTEQPPFDVAGTWTDFAGTLWPACSIVVPPSGNFTVVVGARMGNSNTTTSRIEIGYRLSGGFVSAISDESTIVTHETSAQSRMRYFLGLPPGTAVTVTPQWYITSGSAATAFCHYGQLTVTPEA